MGHHEHESNFSYHDTGPSFRIPSGILDTMWKTMEHPNMSIYELESQREKIMSVEFTIIILVAYGILCIISVFGNALVCYVIFKNKRLHTATNIFIANLAVSDLLVTFINVPFNIARNMLDNWPFGEVPCLLMNFSLVLTTYVSTYTLTSIALDRHRVVLKPLSRRMTRRFAISILVSIWIVAICLSLPYGLYMRVIKVRFLVVTKYYSRCRFVAPEPKEEFEKFLTVITFILQYCVPFALIAIAYGRIVQSLWARTHVGAVTANQQLCQYRAKKKSIKLLIAVVIVFAMCWLPLNMYHLLTDLHPRPQIFQYNSKVFFACHWIAISSTCYNPFVYCWLNENFREEVKYRFSCLFRLWCCRNGRMRGASRMDNKSKSVTRAGSATPSSIQTMSVRRDNTTTSEVSKFSIHCNKNNNGTEVLMHLTNGTVAMQLDDDEDVHTDCTEEAAHSLIMSTDGNGQGVVVFRNGGNSISK